MARRSASHLALGQFVTFIVPIMGFFMPIHLRTNHPMGASLVVCGPIKAGYRCIKPYVTMQTQTTFQNNHIRRCWPSHMSRRCYHTRQLVRISQRALAVGSEPLENASAKVQTMDSVGSGPKRHGVSPSISPSHCHDFLARIVSCMQAALVCYCSHNKSKTFTCISITIQDIRYVR
jgi:hypothetical protein